MFNDEQEVTILTIHLAHQDTCLHIKQVSSLVFRLTEIIKRDSMISISICLLFSSTGLYSPTFYHPQQRPPNYYPPPGPAYGDEFVASYPGYYAELLHGNTPQEGVTTMRGQQQQQQQQTAQQPPNVQTTDGDLLLHNQRHSASTTAGFIYPILVTAGGVRGDRPFYYPSTIVLNTRPAVKDEQLFNQDESSRLSSSLVKSSTEDDEDYYINYPLMFESDFSLY